MSAAVSEEVDMELEMLRALAGDDAVEAPAAVRDDAPPAIRAHPCVRILVARAVDVAPDLVLWVAFPPACAAQYPNGVGDASTVPVCKVELEPSAPIRHRPEEFEKMAAEAAEAEAGGMCINQMYQRIVDGLNEAEEKLVKAATTSAAAAAAAEADKHTADPTIRLGTQLTAEIFNEWKTKFDAEKAARLAKELKAAGGGKVKAGGGGGPTSPTSPVGPDGKVRLTGRQMWDSTLKSADWKLFEKADGGEGGDDDDDDAEDIDFVFEEEDGGEEEGGVKAAAGRADGDGDGDDDDDEVDYDLGEDEDDS